MTRILFVDDEVSILNGIRRMLRREAARGWELEFFSDAREALARMEDVPCDIVVSDMRMPAMDGLEFLSRVHIRFPSTLRVVLSGHADHEMFLRATGHAHQFLSKPCDGQRLIAVIEDAERHRAALAGTRGRAAVERIDRIPSLPVTYARIMRAIQALEPDLEEIGNIVEQDLGISARILQVANSPYFGLRCPVARPSAAVRVLGTDTVRSLALTAGLFQELRAEPRVLAVLETITDHSLSVGSLARRLALAAGLPRPVADMALQAGLMHNIGEFVIAELCPAEFLDSRRQGDPQRSCSQSVRVGPLEVTQAEIGAYVLGIWGLTEPVVEAVALHNAPNLIPGRDLGPAALLYTAHVLETVHPGTPLPEVSAALGAEFASKLGLERYLGPWMASVEEGSRS